MEKESCMVINDFRFYFHQMKPFDSMIRKENVQCCWTNLLWWYKCKTSALGNIPTL